MDDDPGVPETPAVPAELAGELPRRTRLTGNGIISVITAATLLLLGGVGGFNIYIHVARQTQQDTLPRAGSETTGEITRVWFEGRSRVPTVSYDFAANGANFAGEAPVPKQLLHTVEGSKTLAVRYLPGNPAVNYPAAWTPPQVPVWGLLMIPLILILAVAAGVMILLLLVRQRQIVAEGAPAPAVVTKCSRTRSGFWVRYEFRTGEGTLTQGGGWCKSKQEIGAKIWILHLPQNPQRSRPYPLPAFRLAQP